MILIDIILYFIIILIFYTIYFAWKKLIEKIERQQNSLLDV